MEISTLLSTTTPRPRFGVLHFSYANSTFEEAVIRDGHISINLGDYMQSLAVRNFYRNIGIADGEVVEIDRDSLPNYKGGPVLVLMNACFFRRSFPIPDAVIPVFVGFQAKEPIIAEFRDYLKRHEPIGCRDNDTRDLCVKHGIDAFVTGCMTLSFDARPAPPSKRKIIVVYGSGAGDFPAQVLEGAPKGYLADMEFVFQRQIVHRCPLTPADMSASERYTNSLLQYYRAAASLIVTPLHHAAAPCMSSGIPVILCRTKKDTRFSYLRELIDIHVSPNFSGVNWEPSPVDLAAVRSGLVRTASEALAKAWRRWSARQI